MSLKILLSSTLRKYVPDYDPAKGVVLYPEKDMTVAELCKQMNIPVNKIKIIIVDGKHKPLTHVLTGVERVGLFPAIGGG
jgi:sulfur carrier protein ThiS